jgi:phosphoacetylglucosamine mutase
MWKIKVPDRTIFKTTWDETKLVDPLWLQDFIDEVNGSVTDGHSFVRPSGTEDVLRLYTEAKTSKDVDRIANMIIMEVDSKFRMFTE